jgi:lipid II:glycine glycyltransferase (peptidoglycan interpeptide bridge formation enzyme)
MKQKTRYNIRLAGRKGLTVRFGNQEDFTPLFKLYAETSIRDGFVIRDRGYYHRTWKIFFEAGLLDILVAEVERQPVAGLFLFRFGQTAYYMHGMSSSAHREKMASHLLQWEAIRRAKSLGCTRYDLWGAPDRFTEEDALWGVYRFKEGLGGKVIRSIGAWDFPVKPWLYKLYTQTLPRILDLARRRGRVLTRRSIEGMI